MSLRINDIAPNFDEITTEGPINFHEWIGDSWCVLFSHPRAFTPVCATELAFATSAKSEFVSRNVKLLGLAVDSVPVLESWVSDIKSIYGAGPNFPIIGDHEHRIAKLYDMIPENGCVSQTERNLNSFLTVRTFFVISPNKVVKSIQTYPVSVGRNFAEIFRVIDALQIAEEHEVFMPVNWQQGNNVLISPSLNDHDAKNKFPDGWNSVGSYIRYVAQPEMSCDLLKQQSTG